MPDQTADRGQQHFAYAFYPFDGAFAESDVPRKAAEFNEPVVTAGENGCVEAIFLAAAKNVMIDTIKPADTAENALLVRAYEAMGKATVTSVSLAEKIKKIVETDMLEEQPEAVDTARVTFGPFEVKTFLLYL